MQLARTLHSQATEKSFFVLSLNTWNKLSEDGMGGGLPGPTVERGLPGPNHIPACRRPTAQIFLPAPCGPISLELAVGWSHMAERAQHLYGRMTLLRTTEFRGNVPQDREEKELRIQGWEAWNLSSCPQTTLHPPASPKQLPTKNAGCVPERAGRHLAWDQSARASVRGFPWKPMKPCVSTLASKHLLSRRKPGVASFIIPPWLIQQPQKGIQLGQVWRQESGLGW